MLTVTFDEGLGTKRHVYFYSLVLEFLVPYAPAFLHSSGYNDSDDVNDDDDEDEDDGDDGRDISLAKVLTPC